MDLAWSFRWPLRSKSPRGGASVPVLLRVGGAGRASAALVALPGKAGTNVQAADSADARALAWSFEWRVGAPSAPVSFHKG